MADHQPGAWIVSPLGGHVAHCYRNAASTVNGKAWRGRMFCGGIVTIASARPATDSDPRCRRCAERGGEERERG